MERLAKGFRPIASTEVVIDLAKVRKLITNAPNTTIAAAKYLTSLVNLSGSWILVSSKLSIDLKNLLIFGERMEYKSTYLISKATGICSLPALSAMATPSMYPDLSAF